jgi:hypothetical protein
MPAIPFHKRPTDDACDIVRVTDLRVTPYGSGHNTPNNRRAALSTARELLRCVGRGALVPLGRKLAFPKQLLNRQNPLGLCDLEGTLDLLGALARVLGDVRSNLFRESIDLLG